MVQPMALDRWSQVTIYAKPSHCSIGLPRCKALQRRLANTPNRYRQAEFMQMTCTAAQNRIYEVEERFTKVAARGSCSG
jgi:hypothetical protein